MTDNTTPNVEAVLLAGLTDGGDETPALGVLLDAHRELAALAELLGLDLDGEPLDRPAMVVMLEGIERRLRAGLRLLRFPQMIEAPAPPSVDEDAEVTRDAEPGGG